MIENFIFVEDGSVDVDELKDLLDETTKIIIYRQGSSVPLIVQPEIALNSAIDSEILSLRGKLSKVRDKVDQALERMATTTPLWLYKLLKEIRSEVDQ